MIFDLSGIPDTSIWLLTNPLAVFIDKYINMISIVAKELEESRKQINPCKKSIVCYMLLFQDAIERSRDIVSSAEWDCRWQTAPKRVQRRTVPGDSSIMTYRGHSVQKTLIRAKFSPIHTTGQRFIYTGSSCGSVYSELILSIMIFILFSNA